jgi:hypothetical protein
VPAHRAWLHVIVERRAGAKVQATVQRLATRRDMIGHQQKIGTVRKVDRESFPLSWLPVVQEIKFS